MRLHLVYKMHPVHAITMHPVHAITSLFTQCILFMQSYSCNHVYTMHPVHAIMFMQSQACLQNASCSCNPVHAITNLYTKCIPVHAITCLAYILYVRARRRALSLHPLHIFDCSILDPFGHRVCARRRALSLHPHHIFGCYKAQYLILLVTGCGLLPLF